MRVLLVEDEIALAKGIRRGLEQAHFEVECAHDGETGLCMAMNRPYSLVILDLMLPKIDGLCICGQLRASRSSVPILMLSARGTVTDRVRGLETGADDYLAKPFDLEELLARVRALVRRERVHRARIIRIDDLEIDTQTHTVTRAGQEIRLTYNEYLLLEALGANEGRVLSRETIMESIWRTEDAFSNVVDVCVAQLRKKVDADHPRKLIQTVRGFGYRLYAQEEEAAA